MKRVIQIVGICVLLALLGSCGIGYATSQGVATGAVAALRDISVIILALLSLIGMVLLAGISGGGVWVLDKFGGKATGGVSWVGRKTVWVEGLVENGADRVAIRPLAKAGRYLTEGARLVQASLRRGERADALGRQSQALTRSVAGLVRQIRNNPLGQAEQ